MNNSDRLSSIWSSTPITKENNALQNRGNFDSRCSTKPDNRRVTASRVVGRLIKELRENLLLNASHKGVKWIICMKYFIYNLYKYRR